MIKVDEFRLLTIPLFADTDADIIRKVEELTKAHKEEDFPPFFAGRDLAELLRKGIQEEEAREAVNNYDIWADCIGSNDPDFWDEIERQEALAEEQ